MPSKEGTVGYSVFLANLPLSTPSFTIDALVPFYSSLIKFVVVHCNVLFHILLIGGPAIVEALGKDLNKYCILLKQ